MRSLPYAGAGSQDIVGNTIASRVVNEIDSPRPIAHRLLIAEDRKGIRQSFHIQELPEVMSLAEFRTKHNSASAEFPESPIFQVVKALASIFAKIHSLPATNLNGEPTANSLGILTPDSILVATRQNSKKFKLLIPDLHLVVNNSPPWIEDIPDGHSSFFFRPQATSEDESVDGSSVSYWETVREYSQYYFQGSQANRHRLDVKFMCLLGDWLCRGEVAKDNEGQNLHLDGGYPLPHPGQEEIVTENARSVFQHYYHEKHDQPTMRNLSKALGLVEQYHASCNTIPSSVANRLAAVVSAVAVLVLTIFLLVSNGYPIIPPRPETVDSKKEFPFHTICQGCDSNSVLAGYIESQENRLLRFREKYPGLAEDVSLRELVQNARSSESLVKGIKPWYLSVLSDTGVKHLELKLFDEQSKNLSEQLNSFLKVAEAGSKLPSDKECIASETKRLQTCIGLHFALLLTYDKSEINVGERNGLVARDLYQTFSNDLLLQVEQSETLKKEIERSGWYQVFVERVANFTNVEVLK